MADKRDYYEVLGVDKSASEDDEDDEDDEEDQQEKREKAEPQHKLKESIGNIIWVVGLIAYFGISFTTGAWYITWIIFPILACARGLSDAIIDLREANNREN